MPWQLRPNSGHIISKFRRVSAAQGTRTTGLSFSEFGCGRGASRFRLMLRGLNLMRRIFVPACICFMTWTGLPGSDSNLVPENFSGTAKTDKKVPARAAVEAGDADAVVVEIPREHRAAAAIAIE